MASRSEIFDISYFWKVTAFLSIILVINIHALPEAGKATIELSQDVEFAAFKKILFKNSVVQMTGFCTSSEKESPKILLQWKLKYSVCAEKFLNIKPSEGAFTHGNSREISGQLTEIPCHEINHVSIADVSKLIGEMRFKKRENDTKQGKSDENVPEATNGSGTQETKAAKESKITQETKAAKDSKITQEIETTKDKSRRSVEEKKKNKAENSDSTKKEPPNFKVPFSGAYMLIVKASPSQMTKKFKLEIEVDMKGKGGYLSATEWPLLPFFGVMSLLYLAFAIGWLIASCCNWRELLRIQFWIGAVIALGMLEKALFFSEYQNVNITGEESNGLVVFAELVSCLKRTLARILVVIVSMGFGIVKPRLGAALPKVLAAGLLFFILASIEGCLRALSPKAAPSRQQMIAAIPLVVLDSILCWWIFTALVQTTRTLRIRKNLVKLSLYRHFTNTLIFAVIASIVYMAWSIKTHTFSGCTDWAEVWLDEAFWPFLFSLVLVVIMVLWRPTNNNQRYAFTPLVDFSDDEQDDPALSDAFDGMKLRSMNRESNGNLKNRAADDDLKWVEENIPSIPSTVLPSLDSDEEIMTTKLEMSKMD